MTDDDLSPMLSHSDDGRANSDAPMISGRGTKIIADARGAYLAGNLHELVTQMDQNKQARFREVVMRQLLSRFQSISIPSDALLYAADVIEHWLHLPIDQAGNAAFEDWIDRLEAAPPTYGDNEFDRQIVRSIVNTGIRRVESAFGASQAVTYIYGWLGLWMARSTGNELYDTVIQSRKTMERWQLAAAWAIWQNREVPSFEMFS